MVGRFALEVGDWATVLEGEDERDRLLDKVGNPERLREGVNEGLPDGVTDAGTQVQQRSA